MFFFSPRFWVIWTWLLAQSLKWQSPLLCPSQMKIKANPAMTKAWWMDGCSTCWAVYNPAAWSLVFISAARALRFHNSQLAAVRAVCVAFCWTIHPTLLPCFYFYNPSSFALFIRNTHIWILCILCTTHCSLCWLPLLLLRRVHLV